MRVCGEVIRLLLKYRIYCVRRRHPYIRESMKPANFGLHLDGRRPSRLHLHAVLFVSLTMNILKAPYTHPRRTQLLHRLTRRSPSYACTASLSSRLHSGQIRVVFGGSTVFASYPGIIKPAVSKENASSQNPDRVLLQSFQPDQNSAPHMRMRTNLSRDGRV